MNKKNKCIAGIMSLALVATLAGGTILGVSANQRNQSKVTGQSVSTINEYESTGASTYIGHGYDVISQGYVNAGDVEKTNFIFNIQDTQSGKGIRNTNIVVDNGSNKYQDYQFSSESKSDLITKYNNSLGLNLGNGGVNHSQDSYNSPILDLGIFTKITPSISANISAGLNVDNTYGKKSYYKKSIREIDTEYATWLLDEKDYYDYLTDNFKNDVVNLDAMKLFEKYGTHFLKSVKLGGRLDLTYALESEDSEKLRKVSSNLDLQVNNVFEELLTLSERKYATADPNATVDPNATKTPEEDKTQKQYNKDESKKGFQFGNNVDVVRNINNVQANMYIACYGGKTEGFASLSADNTINLSDGAKDWLKNVPNKPAVIGVLDDHSLYPVWDLLDGLYENGDITEEVYKSRKAELEETFVKYGKDNFERIVSSDARKEMSSVKPIELETKSVAVRTETNFNKKYTLNEKFQALHEGSPLGTLILVNAKENGDSYSATSRGLKIRFRLDQDAKKLSSGTSKLFAHRLISSTCMGTVNGYGKVFGTKLLGLGKGAYYVQVTYNDQTTEKLTGTNVLKGVNKNDTITLLDSANLDVDQHDGIDKVSVVFLHSTAANSSTLRGYAQDWITEYELNFN